MGIAENIRRYREAANMTQEDLAVKVGVVRSTVTQWETGWSQPRMGKIGKLAEVFHVSVSDIVSNDAPPTTILPGARRMVASEPAFLPLRGKVHAGDACEPDVFDDLVECPASVASRHPNAYFLRVEGDCMSRIYPEGSLILIDPDMVPQDGSIAVVSIDGADFVMRRLRKGSRTLMLCPDSYADDYADIVVDPNEHTVEFVGTVVWYQPEKELE